MKITQKNDHAMAKKRQTPTRPFAHVSRWLASLKPNERRDWTNLELRHIIHGYAFAMDAAGIPPTEQRETLGELLRNTRRHYSQGMRVLMVADGHTRFHVWPRLPKDEYVPYQIALRAKVPALLGHVAAHEGMHWLKGEDEGHPTQTSARYMIRFPVRKLGVAKATEKVLFIKSRQAAVHTSEMNLDLHKNVLPEAIIVAAVAESLRARAGDGIAEKYISHIQSGLRPYDAYKALAEGKQSKARPLP